MSDIGWTDYDTKLIKAITTRTNGPKILSIRYHADSGVVRVVAEFEAGKTYCCIEPGCHFGFILSDEQREKAVEILAAEIGQKIMAIVMIFHASCGSITQNPIIESLKRFSYVVTIKASRPYGDVK